MSKSLRLWALLVSGLLALPAAAAQRTFVASFGNDANLCSISSPCRGIARALTQTDANGEVIVLDSAGYGAFTITQSVSVIAPDGVYAGISVFSGIGIVVNPGAGGKVVLRGLSINGQGGTIGILAGTALEVRIERCEVANMTQSGILISGGSAVHISGSLLRSNGDMGIWVSGGSPEVFVTGTRVAENGFVGVRTNVGGLLVIDRSEIDNNASNGVSVWPPDAAPVPRVVVRESRIAGNGGFGFGIEPGNTGSAAHGSVERSSVLRNGGGVGVNTNNASTASITVDRSLVSENNFDAVFASGTNAVIYVRDSVVTRNGIRGMWQQLGGVVNTCGNNLVVLNAGGAGNATPVSCNQ